MKLSTPKTAEEIKAESEKREYQNFIYYTNQTLNRLNEGIAALGIQYEKMFQKHQSLHNNLSIDFENHLSEVGLKIGRAFTCIDEFRSDLCEIQTDVKQHLRTVNRDYVTKEDMDRMAGYIAHQQRLLDSSFQDLKHFVENSLNTLKGSVEETIKKTADEVRKDIPSVDPVKEVFDRKLAAFYEDFTGLVTEIARLKEAVKYGEKKFENIYTLIERLQKGAPCPKPAN